VLGHQTKTDQASPVLAEQHHVAKVEVAEQRRPHPLDVRGVGVGRVVDRLVAPPEAHEVGCDDAEAGVEEPGDHLPVQVAPGGLAVQQQDDRGVTRPFVEGGHPQAVGGLRVRRLPRVAGQVGEALVGRAQDVHADSVRRTGRAAARR
jgi:hypothetical protein